MNVKQDLASMELTCALTLTNVRILNRVAIRMLSARIQSAAFLVLANKTSTEMVIFALRVDAVI